MGRTIPQPSQLSEQQGRLAIPYIAACFILGTGCAPVKARQSNAPALAFWHMSGYSGHRLIAIELGEGRLSETVLTMTVVTCPRNLRLLRYGQV